MDLRDVGARSNGLGRERESGDDGPVEALVEGAELGRELRERAGRVDKRVREAPGSLVPGRAAASTTG